MKRACFLGVAAFALMLFVGCGKEEDETLKVCINDTNRWYMDTLVEGWQEIEGGLEVEIVEIPTDGESAELKLSELRTEIMAGEGPDIFVLSCTPPTVDASHEDLFRDLGKAMEAGMFLPLDEYISNAKYIDTSGWNQTVLVVGKTEEGQVVLPLYYYIQAYVYKGSDLSGQELPDSWETLIASDSPIVGNLWAFDFVYSFENLADYQTGKLTFTVEVLKAYLEEYCSGLERVGAQNSETEFPEPIASGNITPEFLTQGVGGALEEDQTYLAVPNREGSVTALVCKFAAINKNTEKAEEAFAFLDFMLSDEVTGQKGFTKGEVCYANGVDLDWDLNGITVNQKIFEENYCKNEKVRTAFEILNGQIRNARFFSELDSDIYDLCTQYRWTLDSASRDQSVRSVYETMKMRLAE